MGYLKEKKPAVQAGFGFICPTKNLPDNNLFSHNMVAILGYDHV